MKRKTVTWKIGFAFLLVSTPFMPGCLVSFDQECCPRGVVFQAQDPWVCPSNCPGGGITRLEYEIEFSQDGEACDPGDDFTIFIHNLTDDIALPPLVWTNPGLGVYEGQLEVLLQQDTTYRLEARREEAVCGEATAQLTVSVVDPGDSHQINMSGALDPPECTLQGGFVPFGPGVKIESVENLTDFHVLVDKDGTPDPIDPRGMGLGLQGEAASGNYSIGLAELSECANYANLPTDEQVLKSKIFLQCDCPPSP